MVAILPTTWAATSFAFIVTSSFFYALALSSFVALCWLMGLPVASACVAVADLVIRGLLGTGLDCI